MAQRRAGRPGAVARLVEDWARERPGLDTSPLEVPARLHRANLRYQSRLTAQIEQHGRSVAGFDVLTALRRAGAPYRLTAGQLASLRSDLLSGCDHGTTRQRCGEGVAEGGLGPMSSWRAARTSSRTAVPRAGQSASARTAAPVSAGRTAAASPCRAWRAG